MVALDYGGGLRSTHSIDTLEYTRSALSIYALSIYALSTSYIYALIPLGVDARGLGAESHRTQFTTLPSSVTSDGRSSLRERIVLFIGVVHFPGVALDAFAIRARAIEERNGDVERSENP